MTWSQIKRLGTTAASFALLALLLVLHTPHSHPHADGRHYANGLLTGP